jgi:uroporphyrinogen decarboxylase
MTSRERVLKTINFKEPDRVPIDLGGTTGASGIHLLAYNNLKKHLGLTSGIVRCNDIMQQLAVIESEIMQRLHLDVIQIGPTTFSDTWNSYPLYDSLNVQMPGKLDLAKHKDNTWLLKDCSGNKFIKPDTSYYFDAEDGQSWFNFNTDLTDEYLTDLQKNTKALYENTDFALSAKFGAAFGSTADPEFLMALIMEPDRIDDMLGEQCEQAIKQLNLINQAIGEYVFCVVAANDLGTQRSLLLSPDLFRERLMPHHQKYTDWLHTNTDMKYFLHSCGAIEPLIESLIEMGVDILNPIQTSADGMDPVKLKEKYAGRIVFWGGGCDTQHVLGQKSTEELIEHVKERIRIFAPGGGFVFNQVHAIQANISPQDICTIFDAAYQYGEYPVNSN